MAASLTSISTPSRHRRMWLGAVIGVVALGILGACDLPGDEPEPEGSFVQSTSLLANDCIWREQHENPVWGTVKLVDCSTANWDYKVLNRVHVDGDGPYPGDDDLNHEAETRCQEGWTDFLVPSRSGWSAGYRWILCFARRATHPEA